jgi:acyl-CoA dehydrogenase
VDFDYSARTLELANRLGAFMREEVAPRDAEWRASAQKGTFPLVPVDDLKRRARALGLWNLFLPSLREDQPGTRLTNLEYAPLAEMTWADSLVPRGLQLQFPGQREHGNSSTLRDA